MRFLIQEVSSVLCVSSSVSIEIVADADEELLCERLVIHCDGGAWSAYFSALLVRCECVVLYLF